MHRIAFLKGTGVAICLIVNVFLTFKYDWIFFKLVGLCGIVVYTVCFALYYKIYTEMDKDLSAVFTEVDQSLIKHFLKNNILFAFIKRFKN